MLDNPVKRLRLVGLAEGISFLVLLVVAMPLKYFAGLPAAVRVVGMLHGLLFVLYAGALLVAAADRRWPFRRSLLLFAAAILPLGTFFVDGWLRREGARPDAPGAR